MLEHKCMPLLKSQRQAELSMLDREHASNAYLEGIYFGSVNTYFEGPPDYKYKIVESWYFTIDNDECGQCAIYYCPFCGIRLEGSEQATNKETDRRGPGRNG